MSASPSKTAAELISAMERLLDEAESSLTSAEPDALIAMAQQQAALLSELSAMQVPPEDAVAMARLLTRSRHLTLCIEGEMAIIRGRLTTSANKKRITGAYAPAQ